MVTVAKNKPASKTKAAVVPTKLIASAAKLAPVKAVKKVVTSAADVKEADTKLSVKAVSKPVTKVLNKAAPKVAPKAVAKGTTKGVTKEATKPVVNVPAKTATKSAAKPVAKSSTKLATPKKQVKGTAPVKAKVSTKLEAPKVEKIKKPKLVRDSFTMPEAEYAALGDAKKTLLAAGVEVKKSQLLRIGLVLLKKTDLAQLKSLIEALPALKAGRPKLAK